MRILWSFYFYISSAVQGSLIVELLEIIYHECLLDLGLVIYSLIFGVPVLC
jgi:hypothetical protein